MKGVLSQVWGPENALVPSLKASAFPSQAPLNPHPYPITIKTSWVLQAPPVKIAKAILIPLGVDGPTERVDNPMQNPMGFYMGLPTLRPHPAFINNRFKKKIEKAPRSRGYLGTLAHP